MEYQRALFYFRSLFFLFLVTQVFAQPESHILNDRCCPVENDSPCECEHVMVYDNSTR